VRIGPAEAKSCGLGVRLTVAGPDGWEVEHYARNRVMTGGVLRETIGLALDEAPGAYTLIARDVLSGLERRVAYTVKGK